MRDIQKEIQDNLNQIEEQHDVKILLAVESGSRAWGFASADSDYDVRFIYVHRPEQYLRIDSMKDVIEWQLDEVLDINGWDLRKALLAFAKGNPNVMEWANSPIIYRKSKHWDALREAAMHSMKPADFFIAHERDLKQVDFVIIDKRSQIIRDTDRFVQCTITLPVRITEVEHDSF